MMKSQEVLKVTDKQLLIVKSSYNKTNKQIAENIKNLKYWLQNQAYLPENEDDRFLEDMLWLNKFNLEKTKKKLDMLYTIRSVLPEFFENREPLNEEMRNRTDIFCFTPLPKLNNEAERIIIYKLKTADASKFDVIYLTKLIFNTIDLRIKFDCCVKDHYILDCSNHTLDHLTKFNPSWIKQLFTIIKKVYSDKIKGIHILNLPDSATVLLSLMKSAISEQLSKRMYVYENIDLLHKVFPKECLPLDYGGFDKSIDELNNNWRKFMEENNDWIVEQQNKKFEYFSI